MDSWPTDDRQPDNSLRKAKGKRKEKKNKNDYPHFQQGLLSALTLCENDGRLEWTSLVNENVKENVVAKGKFVNIFPATRRLPPRVAPTTIVQRAAQGAHFLREHFPDVDITAELIRDEIVTDATISHKLEAFDPYMGNLLESICCRVGQSKQAAFLAFPMGDLNGDLNLSPFVYRNENHTIFKPLGIPSQTFATPIRQIVSSNPLAGSGQSSYLAVRTFGSTTFFEIKATASSSPSARFIDIAEVVSSDVGDRSLVDLKFSMPESGAVLVNDHGAVYVCSFAEGRKTLQLVCEGSTVTPTDFFWRVVPSEPDRGCILASHKSVKRVDFRANNSILGLLSIQQPGELVTSIDTYQGDHLVHLATTDEILWIDDRFPRKPLLGCKHGRQFDRYLEVKTVFMQTSLSFLTSRRNGLMSVYDVCRSDDNLLHINAQPYSPAVILGPHTPYLGYTFFRHPSDSTGFNVGLFTLSESGSIHCLELEMPTGGEETPPGNDGQIFEWSKEVKVLNMRANDLRSDIGPVGARDGSEVNLNPAYDKMFLVSAEDTDRKPENTPEVVYEILERMPFFWQESNGTLEHMVTLFDIAFRSGEEPSHASRADFLTQCALNSTRGYRALVQGRVLSTPLIRQAMWHHRIGPILKHFDTDMSEDTQVTVDRLRRYDLAVHPDRTEHSLRRESEAREQLALDLGMSIDVFSPQPISNPVDMLENMSCATEALSLVDEPPPIHFGYLRPIQKRNHDAVPDPEASDVSEDDLTSPMGVRLLLQDWEIGTDPRNYIYKDPYDDTVPDSLAPRRTKQRTPEVGAQNPLVARSQEPPLVVASSAPAFGNTIGSCSQGLTTGKKRARRVDGF